MSNYTPAQAEFLTGIAADRFRDWRRRNLIDRFGVYPLPQGGWTRDPAHPDLPSLKRWAYRLGDLVCFAVAAELQKLGVELKFAFAVAEQAVPLVHAWASPEASDPLGYRASRFMAAYPAGLGVDTMPGAEAQAVRLSDLNRLVDYAGCAAIVLDLEKLAAALPLRLSAEIRAAAE